MLDAKRKKLSSLVNDNVQRRMDFLEKANQAVY